jgi:hypothetical protein
MGLGCVDLCRSGKHLGPEEFQWFRGYNYLQHLYKRGTYYNFRYLQQYICQTARQPTQTAFDVAAIAVLERLRVHYTIKHQKRRMTAHKHAGPDPSHRPCLPSRKEGEAGYPVGALQGIRRPTVILSSYTSS